MLTCATLAVALGVLAPRVAVAAPPADNAGGASGGASGSASIDAKGPKPKKSSRKDGAASEGPARKTKNRDESKWIYRNAPVRNMGELGVFGGAWFPSPRMELFQADPSLPNQGYKPLAAVSPILGIRGGYYPLRHLGIEGEFAWSPTQTKAEAASVDMLTPRAHIVGQIGLWSVTPFILGGVGGQGVISRRSAIGNEMDVEIHFGGGLKFFLTRAIGLRIEGRMDLSNRRGVGESVTPSPEILLGLFGTLGRKNKSGAGGEVCSGDSDGDNIPDTCDACPDEPGPAPTGCPISDRDHDRIDDDIDRCPDDPESRNGYEDDDGCPDEVPPDLVDLAGVIKGVVFDTDRDTITRDSKPILDRAASLLEKFPTVNVEIVGHTDSRGSYAHNVDLSQRRAKSVQVYLVAKGIKPSRIRTRGAGPSEPIADNETEKGRHENRRIEFKILSGSGVTSTPSEAPQDPSP